MRNLWCRIIHFIYLILLKIYRCWIVWGQNIRVVVVPSILAFAFLGLSNRSSHSLEFCWCWFTISSYLVSKYHPEDLCTAWWRSSCLEFSIVFNWSGRIHECECSCDGFNRVQDLQGLSASQAYYLGAADFGSHWREKTLLYHICDNRVRHDFVFYPTRSVRCNRGADRWCRLRLSDHRLCPRNTYCDYKISHVYSLFFTDIMLATRA